jgi:hypothetical protein
MFAVRSIDTSAVFQEIVNHLYNSMPKQFSFPLVFAATLANLSCRLCLQKCRRTLNYIFAIPEKPKVLPRQISEQLSSILKSENELCGQDKNE